MIRSSVDNNCAIRIASKNGHSSVVELLLNDKRVDKQGSLVPSVDPSVRNNYTIRWASENGHTSVVKLLLNDKRVNPKDYNYSDMRYASINGLSIVKLLLDDNRVDPKKWLY